MDSFVKHYTLYSNKAFEHREPTERQTLNRLVSWRKIEDFALSDLDKKQLKNDYVDRPSSGKKDKQNNQNKESPNSSAKVDVAAGVGLGDWLASYWK